MIRIIRNLLPQDTRAVEYPSGIALVFVGIFMILGIITDHPLVDIHPVEFWIVFSFLIGGLQVYSLINYDSAEPLRTAMAWVTGSFWLWVGFKQGISLESIACIWLGFCNIAAFLINTVILSEKWKI
jgi:hydrogenase/urease accessory protein HupE